MKDRFMVAKGYGRGEGGREVGAAMKRQPGDIQVAIEVLYTTVSLT